ncbi:MAG: PLP-dependent transferase [Bacteroidota bacterium]
MQFETKAIKSIAEMDNLTHFYSAPDTLTVPLLNQANFSPKAVSAFSEIELSSLERKLAKLEGGERACLWQEDSISVWHALVSSLPKDAHVLIPCPHEESSLSHLHEILISEKLSYSCVDIYSPDSWAEAITSQTQMLVLASPTFPDLSIIDLSFAGMFARKHNLILAVDNSVNSPYLQQPLALGAHVVIHSGINFLSKQTMAPFGLLTGNKTLIESVKDRRSTNGMKFSTFDLWLLKKSLETLHLRVERQCLNAQQMALCLLYNPRVSLVKYPFLPSHPQVKLARKQMKFGGAELSFIHKGGKQGARKFIQSLSIIAKGKQTQENYTYACHTDGEGRIKLFAGLEHEMDLCADLEKALAQS